MTWDEQLLTKEWNNKRTEILIRDHFKCQHPGCNVQYFGVEVHHNDYVGHWQAWEYPNDWLTTLCHFHHSEHHAGIQHAEKLLTATLRSRGFLMQDLLSLSCYFETDINFTQSLLKTLRDIQNG